MISSASRRARSAVAAAALIVALSGCSALAPEPVPAPDAPAASPHIGSEGCGVSTEKVDALVQRVLGELANVSESALAGEIPDFAALLAPFETDLAQLTEGVTDPAVLEALARVQRDLQGFADIPAPGNVLEVAGYVSELTAQIQALRDSGAALQQLCTAAR